MLTDKLPLFIFVIVALGCLLLMIAFRSVLIPLTAAAMNLLAAGAAFGVVTAVFQDGFLAGPLGVGTGPIEAFLPVMMLAILFGLSMDYQVFLVSRMHEEWMNTEDNSHSVRIGQAATGRVITAAATIMILVFGSFLLAGQRVIAEFGVGLASAVFLDAFILRTVLVPALMHIIGDRNWWLPRGLDRALPRVAVEGVETASSRPRRAPLASARRATALSVRSRGSRCGGRAAPGTSAASTRPIPHSVQMPHSRRRRQSQGGVDALDLLGCGRARRLIAGVVGDEREVQLGLRAGPQAAQRAEVGASSRACGHRERHPVQRALRRPRSRR